MASYSADTGSLLGPDAARVLPQYLTVIDQIGQFIHRHGIEKGETRFGGEAVPARGPRRTRHPDRSLSSRKGERPAALDCELQRRADVLQFVNSVNAKDLAFQGTSCPITSSAPRFAALCALGADANIDSLKKQIDVSLAEYRQQYRHYYHSSQPDSPRCAAPAHIVLIPVWACSASARTRPKPASPASFIQCDPRDGRRQPAGRRRGYGNPAAMRQRHGAGELQGLHQLRCAAGH